MPLRLLTIAFISGFILFLVSTSKIANSQDWRAASKEPVGLAPDPALTPEAVVQVYGALTASGVEGLELNLLGLTFGINPFEPSIKLPLVGRLGGARRDLPLSN